MIGAVFGPLEVARSGRGYAPPSTSNFHDNHKCTTFNLFLPLRVYFFGSSNMIVIPVIIIFRLQNIDNVL